MHMDIHISGEKTAVSGGDQCELSVCTITTREIVTNSTEIQHKQLRESVILVALWGSFCNINLLYEICWTGHV